MSRSPVLGRFIVECGLAYLRLDVAVSRQLGRGRTLLRAVLSESLTGDELAALTRRIYGRHTNYGPQGLWPWEQRWYERDLPAAPAKVLVSGCGSGRELAALQRGGYQVLGFEPVASLCASARRAFGERSIGHFGYEDLEVPEVRRALEADGPYAAIILGWGSFSHVLERDVRRRALEVLARFCPGGPILVSFHAARSGDVHPSRGERRARDIGRSLRVLRGLPVVARDADELLSHAGFIHRFATDEIVALARGIGRQVRWGDAMHAFGHASLVVER